MYELIYCSVADPNISSSDIYNILKTSRNFNSENNITGCLLFHNKEFIQVLEGNEKIVKELYKRIQADNRHGLVKLLADGAINERTFKGWSMAYHEPDAKALEKLLFIENIKAISELAEKPTTAVKIFWQRAKCLVEDAQA